METAILLGMPKQYIGRLRRALDSQGGLPHAWELLFAPSMKNEAEILQGTVEQARNLAAEKTSPHLFGFSQRQRRLESVSKLAQSFRFRWSDELLKRLNSLHTSNPAPFLERLATELAEEEAWSSQVKPTETGSPLLLPESSFSASGKHKDLWRRASSYGDQENVNGAAKAIQDFKRYYFRKDQDCYQWIDDRDLIFDRNGPRHAAAPFPRNWKFSFQIPEGFHYDIRHLERRKFTIFDFAGKNYSMAANGYINVDPHGYARD